MALELLEAKYGWRYFTVASYGANLGGYEVITFANSPLLVWERNVNGRNFLLLSTERDLRNSRQDRRRREARIACHHEAVKFAIDYELPKPFGCRLFVEKFFTCFRNNPYVDFTHHACLRRGDSEGFMTTSKNETNNELYLTDRFNTTLLLRTISGIPIHEHSVQHYFRISTF